MRTIILCLAVLSLPVIVFGNSKFEKSMLSVLESFEQAKTIEDFSNVEGLFENIYQKNTDQWLPLYFSSMINTIVSFRIEDKLEKEVLLTKAQKQLDLALELAPEESELYALQGFVFQAYILIDIEVNGSIYYQKSAKAFEKAIELDPQNPRAYYLLGLNKLYTPEQFGGGNDAALPDLQKAKTLFNSFESRSLIHPNWGKEHCAQQLEMCKKG